MKKHEKTILERMFEEVMPEVKFVTVPVERIKRPKRRFTPAPTQKKIKSNGRTR